MKEGTPVMGGLVFLLVVLGLSYLMVDERYLPLLFLILAFGIIGFVDDLIKLRRQQNEGLTFWQKIILQTLSAAVFSFYLVGQGQAQGIYVILYIFMIVGCANATNLTDGLDGLLSGCAFIAFLSFALVSFQMTYFGGAAFAVICAGALLGFLFYNFPKAKLFLGDIGSLSCGTALAGLAILIHQELLLVIIGGVFVLEAISVILQVASYKLWKRRIFKMAPLHHHFELLGLSEVKVVMLFWATGIIFGTAALIINGL